LAQLYCHTKKITIHFLWLHTHNHIPGSFYFECPLSAKASHSLVKLIVLHFQGLRPTFLLPPFYDSVRTSCLQKSPCHGVPTAANTSTYFLFFSNVQLQGIRCNYSILKFYILFWGSSTIF